MNNIIDIIERSRMRRALREEHDVKNLDAASQRHVALVKSEGSENDGVRISTVALPGRTKWSPPHDDRDRLVLTLGQTDQLWRETAIRPFPLDGLGFQQTVTAEWRTQVSRRGT